LCKFGLGGKYLEIMSKPVSTSESSHTMLLENLGSSGLAERFIAENERMISVKEAGGAMRARSTKLYAMAASTVGSADRKR
jgi:hypothetical protein